MGATPDQPPGTADTRGRGWMRRSARALREADAAPAAVSVASRLRGMLPGDSRYGDPLSVAGREPHALVGRTISGLIAQRPSALRELGLGALQVWQALSEAQGRGQGDRELTVLFTDLAGFSSWALEAGDAAAVELLRQVGAAVEGAVVEHEGTVVKRLGDGVMAVFASPVGAVAAARQAQQAMPGIEVDGYRPRLRAGLHRGRPRRVGGDYLGQDVNIAARVAEAAKPEEILLSDRTADALGEAGVQLGRGRRLRAPGAPKELRVHSLK